MRIHSLLTPPLALLALACAAPSHAIDAPATRPVTAAEIASFASARAVLAGDAYPGAPAFAAERAPGARAWTVSATLDGAPARGAGQLCHLRRMRFVEQPGASAAQRWRPDAISQYAWVGGAGSCVVPARPVALLQALPDTDVLAAFAQLTPLLQRARLLMAGNSSCAHLRSVPFRLAGMGVSAPPQGAETMLVLQLESDRNSDAQVWVRRRALELESWHVACAPR